jgi:hypothetical protein
MRLILILLLITNLSYGQRVFDLVDSIQISDYLTKGVIKASESIQLYSNGKAEKPQKKWEFELDSNKFIYREYKNNAVSREDVCMINSDFQILKDSIYSGNKKPFEYVEREWKRDHLIHEIHYLPSGTIRSELRQNYNSKGQLQSFTKLNPKDTISYKYLFRHDTLGRTTVKTKFNNSGKLVETILFEYAEKGNAVNIFKLSEQDGKVPLESKSFNNKGKILEHKVYKNGKESYQILYHYDNDLLILEEVKNVLENYTFFHRYIYNKKKKLIEANGKFELEDAFDYQVKYKYKKSLLKKESYYKRDGSLKKEIVYHYDKHGSIIMKVVYQGKKPVYQYQYSVNYK